MISGSRTEVTGSLEFSCIIYSDWASRSVWGAYRVARNKSHVITRPRRFLVSEDGPTIGESVMLIDLIVITLITGTNWLLGIALNAASPDQCRI